MMIKKRAVPLQTGGLLHCLVECLLEAGRHKQQSGTKGYNAE